MYVCMYDDDDDDDDDDDNDMWQCHGLECMQTAAFCCSVQQRWKRPFKLIVRKNTRNEQH